MKRPDHDEALTLATKYAGPVPREEVSLSEVQALALAYAQLHASLPSPVVYVVYRVDEDVALNLSRFLEEHEPESPATSPWDMLIKTKKAFLDEADAQAEAVRLNELNGDKGCRYGYQAVEFRSERPRQRHRQVGPPVMVEGYRVRVVSDSERPDVLAKATIDDRPGGGLVFYGTPRVPSLAATSRGLRVEGEHFPVHVIPNDVLAAILKVAGWKASPP